MAQLYASSRVHSHIRSLAHFFKTGDSLDLKLNLASANYELVQSIPEVLAYLGSDLELSWKHIAEFEETLQEILLKFLREHDRVIIWGDPSSQKELRVPVISFTVKGMSSKAVIDEVEKRCNVGIRNGHMYSLRMVEDIMRLDDPEDGVVRVSMLHYNTGRWLPRYSCIPPRWALYSILPPREQSLERTY
jgi:selenocysteine lyase/cysteine desulfurase